MGPYVEGDLWWFVIDIYIYICLDIPGFRIQGSYKGTIGSTLDCRDTLLQKPRLNS